MILQLPDMRASASASSCMVTGCTCQHCSLKSFEDWRQARATARISSQALVGFAETVAQQQAGSVVVVAALRDLW